MATVPMAASLGKSSNRAAGAAVPAGGALATPPSSSAPSHGTSRSTSSMTTNPNPNPPMALDERGSSQFQQQQQQPRETASSQRQSASSNVTAAAASSADKQSSFLGATSAAGPGGAVAAGEGNAKSLDPNATAPNTRAASGSTAASRPNDATAGANHASQQKPRDTTNNNNAHMSSTTSSVNSPTVTSEQTISYSAERIIGNGSFGVVFQAAVVETGEIVAIKKVLQDKRFKNRELQIMRQLVKDPHSNIVGLKHCFYSQVRRCTNHCRVAEWAEMLELFLIVCLFLFWRIYLHLISVSNVEIRMLELNWFIDYPIDATFHGFKFKR